MSGTPEVFLWCELVESKESWGYQCIGPVYVAVNEDVTRLREGTSCLSTEKRVRHMRCPPKFPSAVQVCGRATDLVQGSEAKEFDAGCRNREHAHCFDNPDHAGIVCPDSPIDEPH